MPPFTTLDGSGTNEGNLQELDTDTMLNLYEFGIGTDPGFNDNNLLTWDGATTLTAGNPITHVDFLRIQKGVAVDVDVPVHLVGVPEGVKMDGGVLEQIIHDLPIRCIPSKIPESIEVDVSGLGLNEVMHISDIEFDEDVEVRIAQERTVCAVALPKAAEEEAEGEVDEELGEAPADAAAAPEADAGDGDEG